MSKAEQITFERNEIIDYFHNEINTIYNDAAGVNNNGIFGFIWFFNNQGNPLRQRCIENLFKHYLDINKDFTSKYNIQRFVEWGLDKCKEKDLARIQSKFKIDSKSIEYINIKRALDLIYKIDVSKNEIKLGHDLIKQELILARLKKKFGITDITREEVLYLTKDSLLRKISKTRNGRAFISKHDTKTDIKLGNILTKFTALRKFNSPEEIRRYIIHKVEFFFHELYAIEYRALSGIDVYFTKGDEVFYRGLNSIDSKLAKNLMEYGHYQRDNFLRYEINALSDGREHKVNCKGLSSYATSITTNPKVAREYAGFYNAFVYVILPPKNWQIVNAHEYDPRYEMTKNGVHSLCEMIATTIAGEYIYGMYDISRGIFIQNPNYKKDLKRKIDHDKIVENIKNQKDERSFYIDRFAQNPRGAKKADPDFERTRTDPRLVESQNALLYTYEELQKISRAWLTLPVLVTLASVVLMGLAFTTLLPFMSIVASIAGVGIAGGLAGSIAIGVLSTPQKLPESWQNPAGNPDHGLGGGIGRASGHSHSL